MLIDACWVVCSITNNIPTSQSACYPKCTAGLSSPWVQPGSGKFLAVVSLPLWKTELITPKTVILGSEIFFSQQPHEIKRTAFKQGGEDQKGMLPKQVYSHLWTTTSLAFLSLPQFTNQAGVWCKRPVSDFLTPDVLWVKLPNINTTVTW